MSTIVQNLNAPFARVVMADATAYTADANGQITVLKADHLPLLIALGFVLKGATSGAVGPTGAAGPTGTTGPTGPTGAAGATNVDPQENSPLTGGTININPSGLVYCQSIESGSLSTLTVTIAAGNKPGQLVNLSFAAAVTTLTVTTPASGGFAGIATPTAASAANSFMWSWNSFSSTWVRVK